MACDFILASVYYGNHFIGNYRFNGYSKREMIRLVKEHFGLKYKRDVEVFFS